MGHLRIQTARPIFNRPKLATKFADQVINVSATSAASSGLFVAAPRRTGKTTFMRQDLSPALTARGALVIYVDLWTDKSANPSDVIVRAITSELAKHNNALVKLAASFGVGGGKIAGVEFSLDRIGMGKEVSIVRALAALSDTVETMIVLIIDEAQHAITTSEGSDAMFSLKAARDELNGNGHFGLRVICTGSNQDKLAMLRNSKDQAFFGAPLVPFPRLGKEYIQWFCTNTSDLPAPLNPDEVATLFERSGNRPEILNAAADILRLDFELEADQVVERFASEVQKQIDLSNSEVMRVVHSLTPLQRSVLVVMAAGGQKYAPFESATFEKYAQAASNAGEKKIITPDVPGVQQALSALQQHGLIWKAARGVYSIEDSAITDKLAEAGLFTGLYPDDTDHGEGVERPSIPSM
jgi:hypothetical protein